MRMTYKVKHEADMTVKEMNNLTDQLSVQEGKYFVMDRTGKVYGRYEDFDDALEHANTLMELEDL